MSCLYFAGSSRISACCSVRVIVVRVYPAWTSFSMSSAGSSSELFLIFCLSWWTGFGFLGGCACTSWSSVRRSFSFGTTFTCSTRVVCLFPGVDIFVLVCVFVKLDSILCGCWFCWSVKVWAVRVPCFVLCAGCPVCL